jgi:hypothetical protein
LVRKRSAVVNGHYNAMLFDEVMTRAFTELVHGQLHAIRDHFIIDLTFAIYRIMVMSIPLNTDHFVVDNS